MLLEHLDRTQWKFADAMAHVMSVMAAHLASEANLHTGTPGNTSFPWVRPEDPEAKLRREALEQLLVALRDGDLHAQGRLSTTRNSMSRGWDDQWQLHSGHHEPISPAQWREGQFNGGRLGSHGWEFIDIRMPRFMVQAIWPAPMPPAVVAGAEPPAYTTPYLQLMQAAIVHFGITEHSQDKKDNIVDWLMTKEIDGEPVSRNLAEAMATLIRLPSSQRGGAKRAWGPRLSLDS